VEKKATFGVWKYYINDEGRARWKCSECGKLCKFYNSASVLNCLGYIVCNYGGCQDSYYCRKNFR
jgi:hypothetical protein